MITKDQFIATVVLDIKNELDLSDYYMSSTTLAEKWYDLLHPTKKQPLEFKDEEELLDAGENLNIMDL